jgi:hypothetical protein
LERVKTEPELKPDKDWDGSVISLMNYPEIIKMMSTIRSTYGMERSRASETAVRAALRCKRAPLEAAMASQSFSRM